MGATKPDVGKEAVVPVLMVAVIVTSGCLGGGKVSAEEIRDRSLASMEKVDSYEFTMEMNTDVEFEGGGSVLGSMGTMSFNVTGEGSVNVTSQEMKMTMTGRASGFGMNTTVYVVNDTMYFKYSNPLMSDRWIRMNLPYGSWNSQNMLKRQKRLLNISEVKYLGSETVDGTETYVLRVEPDPEKYDKLAIKQLSGAQPGSIGSLFDPETFKDAFTTENITAKQWIAKDSNYPVKSSVNLSMSLNYSAVFDSMMKSMNMTTGNGSTRRRMKSLFENVTASYNMKMTMTFSNYNEPVNVELPQGAENATSFRGMLGNMKTGRGTGMGSSSKGSTESAP
ncbi:MAG: DUF6612 family protein [Halobacteria archaeon]|nr:DUF6612 family protein [Halobacteria archaeon]